jgi:hypothetical protein
MAEGIAPGQLLLDPPMIDVSGRHAHVVLTVRGVELLVSGTVSDGKTGV